ncbi:hypothetical protein E2I00_009554, partial [Balaenoptera physalus]
GLADAVVVTVLSSLCITATSIMKIIGDLLCSVQWPTSAPAQVDCSIYEKHPVVAIPCPITYLPVCGLTTSPMGMNATCVLRA